MEHELAYQQRFFRYLSDERRYSQHTLKNYKIDIRRFLEYCNQSDIQSWARLSFHHVQSFVMSENRADASSSTINRRLSSVRSFLNFLVREGVLKKNPALGVQTPKIAKRHPSTLDVDQVWDMLSKHVTEAIDVRDLAILELLYSSGVRVAELVGLNRHDIDLDEGLCRVQGKGNKTRMVPIGRYALAAIQRWLPVRDAWMKSPDEQALFLSQRGERISIRNVQARLRAWGLKYGVSGRLHPHRMRHSFASHLLESSGELKAVQELLGHADISTTQVYTHLDFQHLANVYDQAHPRAKRKE